MLLRAFYRWSTTIIAALLLALPGCQPPTSDALRVDSSDAAASGEDGAAESRRSAAIPIAEVKLEIIDGEGYAAALARHKGNVVLVDFWATWCEPCTENFPHIVELHHRHAAEGLRVISFSSDELSEGGAVREFLAANGAAFDNLQTKFGVSTQTNDTFGIHGVPFYKLYDRQGVLRYQFADVHDDIEHGQPVEKIDERVAELLAEAP